MNVSAQKRCGKKKFMKSNSLRQKTIDNSTFNSYEHCSIAPPSSKNGCSFYIGQIFENLTVCAQSSFNIRRSGEDDERLTIGVKPLGELRK